MMQANQFHSLAYSFGFYLFGLIAIASAIAFVTRKNTVAAAMWLVNVMFALAALYVMLDAQFIAAMQVLVYTGASVVQTFLITAAAFGALSLFGYTTKKDLTGFGSFLIMGVIGLIIASVVNIFLQNSMMQLIISVLGVLIFAGLTAYDTQRLKMTYYALGGDQNAMGVATGFGALSLFINFVNLFQFLLAFMGGNRN